MARKIKETAEQIARRAARQEKLNAVHETIRQGKAYLDTCFGRFDVKSYNDDSGWAVTMPQGRNDWMARRSFMCCLEDIKASA